jgi:hypothetical protein
MRTMRLRGVDILMECLECGIGSTFGYVSLKSSRKKAHPRLLPYRQSPVAGRMLGTGDWGERGGTAHWDWDLLFYTLPPLAASALKRAADPFTAVLRPSVKGGGGGSPPPV